MHIPDGYLSPSSCAVAFAAATPFWYVALKRTERLLQSRVVPLLAVVSAFCFVIMMFNLPIPGGTTAHAVGMGLAAIVLGPWPAVLAISIALMIQALFFGDGGITAFGANSFNMAIVGSFVSYGVYRFISGRAAIASSRRVVAAGLAGYIGINVSAFLAACEFGIQPLLFHDATGAPLYAPYPFGVAIPAMMIAHLTLAGAVEAILTAGVVAYLQKANPSLLAATAIQAETHRSSRTDSPLASGWHGTRSLWLGLGAMMVLTPLGLIAAGVAWGEWSAADLGNMEARRQITHASGGAALPAHTPQGLEHLANIWHAPIAHYAPAFMRNENIGYILSAIIGTGLIILALTGLSWIFGRLFTTPKRPL